MATEQQIPKLAGALVEHQGCFAALSNADAQWVIQHPKEAIQVFVGAIQNRTKETVRKAQEKLLDFITSFKVGGAKKFVAKDNFKEEISDKAIVKIALIWKDFKDNFLDLVEENVPEAELKVHKLLKDSRNPGIIVELRESYTVSLAHVWNAMALQSKGEEGNLLTNGNENIFYVADVNGVVWAVGVAWYGNGWGMSADSVECQNKWNDNNLVLSR